MISTAINYPVDLPPPQWASNSYAVTSPNERTSMDSGRARQRKKYSSVPVMRTATWIMTDTQARTFELWYKVTLKEGTEWFNIQMRHPMGFVMMVCRISGVYQGPTHWGAPSNELWQYGATLEVWERPLLPDEWAILPSFVAHPEIFDLAMNKVWPEATP